MLDGGVLDSSVVNAAVCVEGAKEVAIECKVLTVVGTHNALVGNAAVCIKEYVLNDILPKHVVGVACTNLIGAHVVGGVGLKIIALKTVDKHILYGYVGCV